MRMKKQIPAFISLLTVILMMFTVTFAVCATDEYIDEEPPQIPEDEVVTEYIPEVEPETQYIPEDIPEVVETEPQEEQADVYEETQPPQNPVDELPQVESYEIIVPTTGKLPEIEVSDASLMGGVIAWLCVALGIAVIAGVLVSQRTRQINSGSGKPNVRR